MKHSGRLCKVLWIIRCLIMADPGRMCLGLRIDGSLIQFISSCCNSASSLHFFMIEEISRNMLWKRQTHWMLQHTSKLIRSLSGKHVAGLINASSVWQKDNDFSNIESHIQHRETSRGHLKCLFNNWTFSRSFVYNHLSQCLSTRKPRFPFFFIFS